MAMFVLVVDTSIMNVSISAVVADLGTTVSAIQSAIALEALVSAAFILIGSKIGDLFGRKRAYALGLLAYAIGALAMAWPERHRDHHLLGRDRWARSVCPAPRDAIPDPRQLRRRGPQGDLALVGAAAAIAAAVGPLIGGFITTFLSYRVAFGLEVVVIAIAPVGSRLVHDGPTPLDADRPRRLGPFGPRHGRPGAGHPRLAGRGRIRRPAPGDRRRLARPLAWWLVRRSARESRR